MSDEVYDYEADCAEDVMSRISEYDRAVLVASTVEERSEQAMTRVARILWTTLNARSEAGRLWALMDAGEPHDSGTFKNQMLACQHINRELAGYISE